MKIPRRRKLPSPDEDLEGKKAVLVHDVTPKDEAKSGIQKAAVQPALIPLVPAGSQNLGAGESLDFNVRGDIRVIEFHVDVPLDVDATVSFDEADVIDVADQLGLVGSLRFGDFSRDSFLPLANVRIEATNNAASSRDVRAWLVVLPA